MANEVITIKVNPMSMIVVDGLEQGARLWYQARGLDIYVWGAVPVKREHAVHYLAVENCVARHIPALSLRCVRALRNKPARIDPKQKRMF
jgi:hypothetical protein